MGDVIKAELESLDSFATFLGDQIPELTADLNDLKNQMDTITSSAWKDKGGEGFKTSFSSFIIVYAFDSETSKSSATSDALMNLPLPIDCLPCICI